MVMKHMISSSRKSRSRAACKNSAAQEHHQEMRFFLSLHSAIGINFSLRQRWLSLAMEATSKRREKEHRTQGFSSV